MTPLRTVIIGSYTREPSQLRLLYEELALAGCQILSPRSLGFDANSFVRLPGEELLADFDIEMSHLSAIVQSDFIWLHIPRGYIGASGLFELGFSVAHHKPIFSYDHLQDEPVLDQCVHRTSSMFSAVKSLSV